MVLPSPRQLEQAGETRQLDYITSNSLILQSLHGRKSHKLSGQTTTAGLHINTSFMVWFRKVLVICNVEAKHISWLW